ncbi:MAG: hypothetical protein HY238_04600 [Acidobacteria bacterium]|nr:hypothetical protein [Acidobacteriota bacterium]
MGLSLVLGTAGLSLAADEKKDTKPAADASKAPKKKHSKKHKGNGNKPATPSSTTPAPTK